MVVPGSGIQFRYFIFEISGKPSFIEAVLWRIMQYFDKKLSSWINKTLLLLKQQKWLSKFCVKIHRVGWVTVNTHIFFFGLILLLFLSVSLHESGTRNVLLGSWPNNTEVYFITFISTQNHTVCRIKVSIVSLLYVGYMRTNKSLMFLFYFYYISHFKLICHKIDVNNKMSCFSILMDFECPVIIY